jgi:RND family efflux transporter MFP subunit
MKNPTKNYCASTSLGWAMAALMLAASTGCKPKTDRSAAKSVAAPATVKLAHPSRGNITRTVSLPGTVAANRQAILYSKVAGYLKAIHVDKGDEAQAGQLLAEIEVPELIAELARYKAEAEIADLDYKRALDAHKKAPDLIMSQSIDSAKAKSLMAKAGLERAETLLSFCRITAPFRGVITRRGVDAGAFIPAATGSAAQNAAVVTLMDFDVVRVQVAVPESEVSLIRNGLPATVTVEGLAGRKFEGKVTRFSHALDDATKTMLIEIDLENPKHELRPGMFASVKLGVEQHTETLLVPVESVVVEKTGTSIFTAAEGKAKKIPVKTGFNDGISVEVLEGLGPNEPVILVGKSILANGQSVQIAEGK